ncbi:MAG TPA: DinB family protein [Longimicrobium sp.]|nr:DinB family protein [Longimicrobium sp.]
MYRAIDDFDRDWEEETGFTLAVLRALTDASLQQRVSPEGRTLGRLAWHIAETVPEMMGHAGLKGLEGPEHGSGTPLTVAEIVDAYEAAARSLADAVRSQWSDDELPEEIPMYGEMWTKGRTLMALVLHQTHHRGQMTVLMRQAGLKVPGCYGPAAEEWARMGMPAMA